jgi:hypothetical protein
MPFDPKSYIQNLNPNVKKGLLALLVLILVGASGFWYGRQSAPEKVVIQVVEKEKVVEKEVKVEVVKWKTKTEKKTEYVRDQVTVADANTKCDETFDRETGKLVHRVCERTSHTDTSVSERRLAELTLLTETLQNTLTEKDKTIEKLKSTTTIVTNNVKDNWLLGLGVGVVYGVPGLDYSLQGAYRLVGPFWLGATIASDTTFKYKSGTIDIIMTLP